MGWPQGLPCYSGSWKGPHSHPHRSCTCPGLQLQFPLVQTPAQRGLTLTFSPQPCLSSDNAHTKPVVSGCSDARQSLGSCRGESGFLSLLCHLQSLKPVNSSPYGRPNQSFPSVVLSTSDLSSLLSLPWKVALSTSCVPPPAAKTQIQPLSADSTKNSPLMIEQKLSCIAMDTNKYLGFNSLRGS